MPLNSLGIASDTLVLRGQSQLEELDDRFLLRSPNEPDFWFGNLVIFKDRKIDPEAQIAQFQRDFPDAKHVTLEWDATDMDDPALLQPFVDRGFTVDICDVLTLEGSFRQSPPAQGLTIRPLVTDADWSKATELQGLVGVSEGREAETYLPFIQTRMEVCRAQVESGLAQWFGAFDGDVLAGDLGIYADARTARFQAVEVRDSYRRRGICAAMLSAGADWALGLYPDTQLMIVAEPEGAAGRIYRRCGFAKRETITAVYRGPTS